MDIPGLSHYYLTVASVHRRFKSPYWVCQYLSADGRWLKRSTKLKDRKKALEWCIALQGAQDAISRGSASEAQLRAIIDSTMERSPARGSPRPRDRNGFVNG